MAKYALLIASAAYHDKALSRLASARVDVERLSRLLKDARIGGFDEVYSLTDEPESVLRRRIAAFVRNRRKDDLILLYFSGHGVLDDDGHLHFAALDTERDALSATAVAASFVKRELDRCYSRRQVLILDCCHGGAYARGTKGAVGASVDVSSALGAQGYGRVVLAASESTQFRVGGRSAYRHASPFAFHRIVG